MSGSVDVLDVLGSVDVGSVDDMLGSVDVGSVYVLRSIDVSGLGRSR